MPERLSAIVGWDFRGTRRQWMIASLLGGVGTVARGQTPKAKAPPADVAAALGPIMERARAVKLRGFAATVTEHYIGVGDATKKHREAALRICWELARAFRTHFQSRGFEVEFPDERMLVITLKDRDSYETFVGEATSSAVGGHYDVASNQLVTFDFGPEGEDLAVAAGRVNTFTLVHEAMHQLTYNTGLLNRKGDVPVAVSEGLAMYGELWRPPPRRVAFGATNSSRLQVFVNQGGINEETWFPVEKLVTDDGLFQANATAQQAYAQGWVLGAYLMSRPKLRAFQNYLKIINERKDARQRARDLSKSFGDLKRLDRDLRNYANRALGA
jgi:hypothetical protein